MNSLFGRTFYWGTNAERLAFSPDFVGTRFFVTDTGVGLYLWTGMGWLLIGPTTGTGVEWGLITGTLSNQTDLQTALNGKANTSHNQDASTINAGTLDGDRLPALSPTKKGGAPATGTPSGKYLKDDGTWATPTAAAVWGGITGTLSNQTDLQGELDGKADSTHTHPESDVTDWNPPQATPFQRQWTRWVSRLALAMIVAGCIDE